MVTTERGRRNILAPAQSKWSKINKAHGKHPICSLAENAEALPRFQAAKSGSSLVTGSSSSCRASNVPLYRQGEHNKTHDLTIAGHAFVVPFGVLQQCIN